MTSSINYVNMQNIGDIPMMSLESQVMQLLNLLISFDSHLQENVVLNDTFNHQNECSSTNLLSSRQHVFHPYFQIQYLAET